MRDASVMSASLFAIYFKNIGCFLIWILIYRILHMLSSGMYLFLNGCNVDSVRYFKLLLYHLLFIFECGKM